MERQRVVLKGDGILYVKGMVNIQFFMWVVHSNKTTSFNFRLWKAII